MARLSGGCVCGAVAYSVEDAFSYAMMCHCTDCQKATGSAFKPMGGIRFEDFEVTGGSEHVTTRGEPEAHDAFCARCGSLMWSVVRGGEWVHVTYGTLTDAPSLAPQSHIFVRSNPAWHVIGDDLPQYRTFPGAPEDDHEETA